MLKFFFLLILLTEAHALSETNSNPRPRPWPNRVWREVIMLVDDAAYSLSQALFDQIDKFEISPIRTNYVEVELKIEREVFDNHDVLNSFSVVDYTSINLKSTDLSYEFSGLGSNLSLGLSLELGGGLDFVNIRQVSASQYSSLPTTREEFPFLEDDGTIRDINTNNGGYFDPSWRPRTSELWNFFTFPFRIPTSLKKLEGLENGELVSYGVSGYVEFGAGAGFNLISSQDETQPLELGLNLEYKTFLKGTFRITVLKENERFVRVKITRAKNRGSLWSLGGGASDFLLYEGFLVFEDKKLETNLLETKVNIIPFKFKTDTRYSQIFDLGFRYDLKNEVARDAFEKAVKGSFIDSIDLDGRIDEQGNIIVQQLFKRSSQIRTRSHDYELNLNLYRSNWGRSHSSIEAVITLEDGEHFVFKEESSSDKRWKLLWGNYEKLNYNFIVSVDKTSYDNNVDNSLQLVAQASIEDSHTSGFEMSRYIKNIRTVLAQRDILPDLPLYLPSYSLDYSHQDLEITPYSQMGIARYRKSSFFYGYNIDQATLIKFINTPKNKMWNILEKAFDIKHGRWANRYRRTRYRLRYILPRIANVPLFLANIHLRKGSDVESAKRIIKNWHTLQNKYLEGAPINQVAALLSQMFKSKHYGYELMKVILFSLENIELDYFLVATNNSFGRIQERGRVTTNPEYLLNLTDENIGFERLAGGYNSDPDILVSNLKTKVIDEDEKVEVSFELDHNPKIVYLKLFKTNRLQPFETAIEIAYDNKTRFKKGVNKIVMNKKSLDELSFKLGKSLENKNFYNLTISTSVDSFSWSKIATDRFRYEGRE